MGGHGNRLFSPITSLEYGLALALTSHMESYSYIVSQPTVLVGAAARRFREILNGPGSKLTADPLPLDAFDDEADRG